MTTLTRCVVGLGSHFTDHRASDDGQQKNCSIDIVVHLGEKDFLVGDKRDTLIIDVERLILSRVSSLDNFEFFKSLVNDQCHGDEQTTTTKQCRPLAKLFRNRSVGSIFNTGCLKCLHLKLPLAIYFDYLKLLLTLIKHFIYMKFIL